MVHHGTGQLIRYKEVKRMDEAQELMNMFKMLLEKVDNLETGQMNIKQLINDQILEPVMKERDERDFQDFRDRYGSELEDYSDKVKLYEGDDFDLYRTAYDEVKGLSPEQQDEKILELTDWLDQKLDKMRDVLGLGEGDKVEVESDGSGDIEVKVNDVPITEGTETISETKEKEVSDNTAPTEDKVETTEEVEETETEETPEDEDERIRAELRAYRDKNLK